MKGGYWIWIMLIIAVVWLCIQGLVFLSRRTRRIGFVSRIYEKNKHLGRLVSLFPLAICLPFGLINGVTVLVVFIHLFVFWVMCDLIGFCINKIRKRERGKHYINGFIAIGLTAIYLGIGWYFAHHIFRTDYTLHTDKPLGQESFRVALIADTHIGEVLDSGGLADVVERINADEPDIAAVCGDLVDDGTSESEMKAACEALGRLKTKYGVYYVYGNHDKGYNENRGYDADDVARELEKNGMSMLDPYETVDEIPKKDVKVVYQGVPGAYAYIAMKRFFGEEAQELSVRTWRDALEMITGGQADFAVLPLENSTAGSVTEVYDLLSDYPVYIVAEEFVEIDHNLLALPGADIEDIRTVYSHAQALFQCASFLEEHKDWDKISTPNTAASAKKVNEDGDKTCCAIASKEAGDLYGLKILKEKINDLTGNTTRFVIVTKERRFRKNAGKVSVIFETPNEKGTLYNLLSQIVYNDLNMMKIESRPLRSKKWDSRFFVEFEGNLEDPGVKYALRGMYEEAKSMRLLGNY